MLTPIYPFGNSVKRFSAQDENQIVYSVLTNIHRYIVSDVSYVLPHASGTEVGVLYSRTTTPLSALKPLSRKFAIFKPFYALLDLRPLITDAQIIFYMNM